MVGTHSTGGVSYADALHGSGVIGRHSLSFDDRHSLNAENLAGDRSAAAQNLSQRSPLTDLLHQFNDRFSVAKLGNSGFHGYRNSGAHFNGIHSEIIVHAIDLSDSFKVIDTTVSAMGPDSLVFGLFSQIMAVFVIIGTGAPNHAAPVAAVGGRTFTATSIFGFGLGFTADLFAGIEASPHEIFGRISAGFVYDIG